MRRILPGDNRAMMIGGAVKVIELIGKQNMMGKGSSTGNCIRR